MRATVSSVISVSTNPGQTAFTVTPEPATSAATDRVSPTSACLAAEYAARYLPPLKPAVDARLTTRPQRRSSIPGRNARVQRKAPVALTAMRRFHSSSEVRTTGIEAAAPALLTSTATGPSSVAWRPRASTLASLVTSHTTALAWLPSPTSSAA